MKRLLFCLIFSDVFFSSFSQRIVPLSDIFMQVHKLTASDLGRLQVYVKFVNSRIYKEPVSSPNIINIGNNQLQNLTPGIIISSDYRPVSNCKINVDFGNGTVITFFHNAGDNEFYTFSGGICLMIFTDETITKTPPVLEQAKQTESKAGMSDLQDIIDKAPDNTTLKVPFGRYISNSTININGRNSLVILFTQGCEIFCSNLYEDVITISNSHNIKIVNGQFKHIRITGDQCSGSVFQIFDSENINIENCDINGCGIVGVSAGQMTNLTVKNCYIHDNRYSAYSFGNNIRGIKLISNKIANNPKYASWQIEAVRNLDIYESDFE